MGTRSLTVVQDTDGVEICVMYRQFDGYPEGHGGDLADFIKNKQVVNGIPYGEDSSVLFNGGECFAAQLIAHFKNQSGCGGIYLHPAGTRDKWEDYTYFVKVPSLGGKFIMSIHGKRGEQIWAGFLCDFDSNLIEEE